SPKFKFVDEDLVILRAPRKNDVYSLDLKNICLVAKATKDEAVLLHRRLGHVNFKNINKLVKGNLVRGLPSKTFKLDHSCLACRKGKHILYSKTKHIQIRHHFIRDCYEQRLINVVKHNVQEEDTAHPFFDDIVDKDTAHPFFDDIVDKDAAVIPDLERKSDETEE
ncbi:putative ribonuclease H-like domain-containing protein, partial [Tanacetum coccineum]